MEPVEVHSVHEGKTFDIYYDEQLSDVQALLTLFIAFKHNARAVIEAH